MQVILLERVETLGQMGDVVNVKAGYARNFLLPQNKALRATPENRENFEARRVELETTNAERRSAAEIIAGGIEDRTVILVRQASEGGQLYGSVRPRDIANALNEQGTEIERTQVKLETPIKMIGLHTVRIATHPEVVVEITVNVARSEGEAALQAEGKSLIDADAQDIGIFDDEEEDAGDAPTEAETVAEAAADGQEETADDTAGEDSAGEDTAAEDTAGEDSAGEDESQKEEPPAS
ncbi:MAG: 50S ribosomal protein L9 [Alphaproteobacteria bacterium]|nr:50S ribosomal protein L9 [Alphaproteobacteria bacterium]